jgi:hypothetical protein
MGRASSLATLAFAASIPHDSLNTNDNDNGEVDASIVDLPAVSGVSNMLNSTLSRLLTGFAALAVAYGAYTAFTDNHPGMGVLLAFATIAAAIPTIMSPGK